LQLLILVRRSNLITKPNTKTDQYKTSQSF